MKTLLMTVLALTTTAAMAQEIAGTMILKGRAKGTASLSGQEINCELTFDKKKIRNLLGDEDRFGNPAYQALGKVRLESQPDEDGRDRLRLRYKNDVNFINLWTEAEGRIVRDNDYFAPTVKGAGLTIDSQGNVKTLTVPTGSGTVNCLF